MRISTLLAVPLFVGMAATPTRAPAQVQVHVDARLGAEIPVFGYSSAHWGDWHANYRKWTPTTLYFVDGRYYRHSIAGARPIVVYHYKTEYFMPPHEKAWVGVDRRFDYKHQPLDEDFGRARPHP